MSAFCNTVIDQYRKKDIYGNGNVLTKDCNVLTRVDQYNTYCQTPTTSTEYETACDDKLVDAQEETALVFNQFITSSPDAWPGNIINSGGYILSATGAEEGIRIDVRSGGNTVLYVITLNDSGDSAMYYATLSDPEFAKLPTVLLNSQQVRVSDNTHGFDVDLNGVIYFHHTFDTNKVDIYKFDPRTDLVPSVAYGTFTVDNDSVQGPLSVSPDGNSIGTVLYTALAGSGPDVHVITLDPPSDNDRFTDVVEPGTVPSTILCNDAGDVFYAVPLPVATSAYYWRKSDVNETSTCTPQHFVKRMPSTDVFGYSTATEADKGKYYVVKHNATDETKDLTGLPDTYMVSMDVDTRTDQFFFMSQSKSVVFSVEVDGDPVEIVNYAADQDTTFLDISWNGQAQLFYSSMLDNNNRMQMVDLTSNYALLNYWTSVDKPVQLCNNGDMILVENGKIVGQTNTGDGTTDTATEFLRGDCDVVLTAAARSTSTSGLYQASTGPGFLQQNVANEANLNTFCKQTSTRLEACMNSYGDYCQVDAGNDPRCFCFENQDGILATMFDMTLLEKNPLLLSQLRAVAPCLSPACNPYFTEPGLISTYLENFQCSRDITICTNVLELGTGSGINGDINSSLNCGIGSNIPCGDGCPIGTDCDVTAGICRQVCTDDGACGEEGLCNVELGLCFPRDALTDGGLSTTWIVVIVVVTVLVVGVSIWLGIKYGKGI